MGNGNVTADRPPFQAIRIGNRQLDYYSDGHGPALIFVHGGRCSADDWFNLTDVLCGQYQMIMPDGLVNPFDGWMVWQLLDWLGVDKAVLLGHSWGGNVTQEMYRIFPDRVQGMIDIDSSATGPNILALKLPNDRFSAKAAAMYEARREQMLKLRSHHQGDYPSDVTIKKRMTAYDRHEATPEQLAAGRPAPQLRTTIPDRPRPPMIEARGRFIKCPCMKIVTGRGKLDRSDYTPQWEEESKLADEWELVAIKEAGHWPWLEQKEWFLSVVMPFFERVT